MGPREEGILDRIFGCVTPMRADLDTIGPYVYMEVCGVNKPKEGVVEPVPA